MSTISIYDVNSYITNDSELANIAGHEIEIFPALAYEDVLPPFIIYVYSQSIPSVEAFWYRSDTVIYGIYDNDVDRLFNLTERLMEILGKGDQISQPGGVVGTDVRILSTQVTAVDMGAAEERDGWYRSDLEFIIHHVKR